jgi:hypothetical protein
LDDDIPKTAGEDNLDIGISLLDDAIVDDVKFETVFVGCGVEVGTGVSVVAGFSGLIVIEVVVGVGNIEEAV